MDSSKYRLALGIGFYSAGILATAAVYMIMTRLKRWNIK